MHRYLLAALLAAGALLAMPGARAESCAGNLIGVKPLLWGDGARLGEVQVYYNPANGRNCARVVHGGETWGKRRLTSIQLETCTRRVFLANNRTCPAAASTRRYWTGMTRYSTSALSLPGQGRCVDAFGSIARWASGNASTVARVAGFCGG